LNWYCIASFSKVLSVKIEEGLDKVGDSFENGELMRLPKNSSAGDFPSGAELHGVYL